MYDPCGHPYFVQELHQELRKAYAKRGTIKRRLPISRCLSGSLAQIMIGLGARFTAWGQHLEYLTRHENNQPV